MSTSFPGKGDQLLRPPHSSPSDADLSATGALTIIGTVHLDPKGSEKLTEALEKFVPDVITTEVSSYALSFRESRGLELLKRLDDFRIADGSLPIGLEMVAEQLRVPYEATATREWAARHQIPWHCLGNNDVSKALLAVLERELLTPANLEFLAKKPTISLPEQVGREYVKARNTLENPRFCTDPELSKNDDWLAQNILEHCSLERRLVHVGGWAHLPGLLIRLRPWHPNGTFLSEIRSFRKV